MCVGTGLDHISRQWQDRLRSQPDARHRPMMARCRLAPAVWFAALSCRRRGEILAAVQARAQEVLTMLDHVSEVPPHASRAGGPTVRHTHRRDGYVLHMESPKYPERMPRAWRIASIIRAGNSPHSPCLRISRDAQMPSRPAHISSLLRRALAPAWGNTILNE